MTYVMGEGKGKSCAVDVETRRGRGGPAADGLQLNKRRHGDIANGRLSGTARRWNDEKVLTNMCIAM